MIRITNKTKCCGCSACVQICPKLCISMVQDQEGFLYPKANESECIRCGLCTKVCPVLHPYECQKPDYLYAAINRDSKVRMESSSGGIFYLLATQTLSHGGVVFGARFDEDWQVVIDSAETIDYAKQFMGSKYLQATVDNSYKRCKEFLDSGREVLYCGTPCQISGLRHFLQKPYKQLLLVDFICHGVPSPEVWRRYIGETISTNAGDIKKIQFRNKKDGWDKYSIYFKCTKQQETLEITTPANKDLYMRAFLSNITLRPSCYACPAREGRSQSDITIADFWGVQNIAPSMYDNKGTSLVIIHNAKGLQSIPFEYIQYEREPIEALRDNPSYYESPPIHPKRKMFFDNMESAISIRMLMAKSLTPTLWQKFLHTLHPIRIILQHIKHIA